MRIYNESGAVPYHLRSSEQIGRFFDGLELVDPGMVEITQWRPDNNPFGAEGINAWAASLGSLDAPKIRP